MVTTQPRFEWRVWAERLEEVAERVRALSECRETRDTAEDYIVARVPGTNPKVRYDRLDIKVLRSVRDGFQQWDVGLKVPFPVPAETLAGRVLPMLGVGVPELVRDAYTHDQLFTDVVARSPDLAAVGVKKHREFYTVHGCIAEVADVTIGGHPMQTAALESVDLDLLREACDLVGIRRHDNVSYPAMIRRTIGWDTV